MKPRVVAFADYLDAVERVHGVDAAEIASSAGVSVGEVRRWRRRTHAPSWRTVESLSARFGGDGRLLYLGVVLERFARQVGCSLEEAAALPVSKRRSAPGPKARSRLTAADRRQMSLLSD